MKSFSHFNARSVEEAVSILRRFDGKARLLAGGTDILGKMKDEILPTYPEALVNIKTIPGMEGMEERDGMLRIGAATILEDMAHDPVLSEKYTALGEAVRRTASPHLREMGTIGGNICQDIRCWYYRQPNNRFPCLRKGGGRCYALEGDNRYHSIFGPSVKNGCIAVHPSDIAAALIVLDASIKTSKRTVAAEDFFQVAVSKTTVLDDDEIVTGIEIPTPPAATKSTYLKFSLRKSIDFPIVSCAAAIACAEHQVSHARICLNAVYLKPYRAHKAEAYIMGKEINETHAEKAGEAVVARSLPIRHNAYMVQIAKALIKRAILACK